MTKKKQRKTLNGNIYVFKEVIKEEHILEVKSTQYVPNRHVRWFPSGP